MKSKELKIFGYLEDGTKILKGVFPLYDTIGIPSSFLFGKLKENGYMPYWADFKQEALQAGWKIRTIRRVLSEGTEIVYGAEFRDKLIQGLKLNG